MQFKRPKALSEIGNLSVLREIPFTHNLSRDMVKEMEMDEISRIKQYIDKTIIPCSGQALRRAILSPEGYERILLKKENFPEAGSMLIVDPFKKSKKKKKKGKKKKKK